LFSVGRKDVYAKLNNCFNLTVFYQFSSDFY